MLFTLKELIFTRLLLDSFLIKFYVRWKQFNLQELIIKFGVWQVDRLWIAVKKSRPL